jgi:hypothetical protein
MHILGDNLNNYENGMVCVFIFENEIFSINYIVVLVAISQPNDMFCALFDFI